MGVHPDPAKCSSPVVSCSAEAYHAAKQSLLREQGSVGACASRMKYRLPKPLGVLGGLLNGADFFSASKPVPFLLSFLFSFLGLFVGLPPPPLCYCGEAAEGVYMSVVVTYKIC